MWICEIPLHPKRESRKFEGSNEMLFYGFWRQNSDSQLNTNKGDTDQQNSE